MAEFDALVSKLPTLYKELVNAVETEISDTKGFPKEPGVYLLLERGRPTYVGRTNNLKNRMSHHRSSSPYQATFAVKLARESTRLKATYKKESGLKQLMNNSCFKGEFDKARVKIGTMDCKFVVIEDDRTQYLFELYAALASKTKYNSFGNT